MQHRREFEKFDLTRSYNGCKIFDK